MGKKTIKKSVSLSNWPFNKSDIARLYWMDHPYIDEEGNWTIAVYFKGIADGKIKRCDVPWGTIGILKIGEYYIGGRIIDNRTNATDWHFGLSSRKVGLFSFNEEKFEYVEGSHIIETTDGKFHDVIKNIFIARSGGLNYHIPVLEVIRSILITNKKLAYAILEPDSLSFLFLLQRDETNPNKVIMEFTRDYPKSLLTEENISHLVWLSTNSLANTAWNEVYRSAINPSVKGLHFPFPLDKNFTIKARYRQKGNIIRIEEIMDIGGRGYSVGVDEIAYYSPNNVEFRVSNQPKLRSYSKIGNNNNLTIDSEGRGTKHSGTGEIIEFSGTKRDFYKPPIVIKHSESFSSIRVKEDKNTKKLKVRCDNLVSTADIGGWDSIKGLEFININEVVEDFGGDIGKFLRILSIIKDRHPEISVNVVIDVLPEGRWGKRFCKLDDGCTPRKYVLAQLTTVNGLDVYIIEVERQNKPLTTLVIIHRSSLDKNQIAAMIMRILVGLVNNNGVWDGKILKDLLKEGIESERIHHTRTMWKAHVLVDRLYKRLLKITEYNLGV